MISTQNTNLSQRATLFWGWRNPVYPDGITEGQRHPGQLPEAGSGDRGIPGALGHFHGISSRHPQIEPCCHEKGQDRESG